MIFFCWGATTLACWTVALLFLRHWLDSRDRLFAFFAAAFAILGLNWLALAAIDPANEARHLLYLLRVAAFVTIIVGIVDKNRAATPR
jgi:hypothetical protein